MLRQLVLQGSLAQFGGPYLFDVSSVQEAVHALTTQVKGAYGAIRRGEFTVFADELQLDENEIGFSLGAVQRIRVVPVPAGSKRQGVFKVILGVALLGVGLAVGTTGSFLGLKAASWFTMGAGMVLNGVAQMLSPMPSMSTGDNEKANERQSYVFNSPVNVCEEGHCIPVVYGKAYSGSIVASSGLSVDDVDLSLDDVTGFSASGGVGRISASWTAVSGARDYQVKWTGPANGSTATTRTSVTKLGLPAGNYTVSVLARNGSLTSKNWKSASAEVTASGGGGGGGNDGGDGGDNN